MVRELNYLEIIKQEIGTKYIGDDCAYLKELGLVVSQDSLVEDVHFKKEWYTAYQLGYKAISVNISDILASGAKPSYATIALSLPKNLDENFVKDFYKGVKAGLYGAEIIGGDITGADKIYISITVFGSDKGRKISSRKNAKVGYSVITKGVYGASSRGLANLFGGNNGGIEVKKHIEPSLDIGFSKIIAQSVNKDYAMMDTSDGLADALFKIAEASGVKIKVDYEKIAGADLYSYKEVMLGGEDYNLVAVVPKETLQYIEEYDLIGEVLPKDDSVVLVVGNKKYSRYDELGVYNHFGE